MDLHTMICGFCDQKTINDMKTSGMVCFAQDSDGTINIYNTDKIEYNGTEWYFTDSARRHTFKMFRMAPTLASDYTNRIVYLNTIESCEETSTETDVFERLQKKIEEMNKEVEKKHQEWIEAKIRLKEFSQKLELMLE